MAEIFSNMGKDIAFARRKGFYFQKLRNPNQDKYKEYLSYHSQIAEIQR